MLPSCLGAQDELHFGSVGRKIHVALKRSCSERVRERPKDGKSSAKIWPSKRNM